MRGHLTLALSCAASLWAAGCERAGDSRLEGDLRRVERKNDDLETTVTSANATLSNLQADIKALSTRLVEADARREQEAADPARAAVARARDEAAAAGAADYVKALTQVSETLAALKSRLDAPMAAPGAAPAPVSATEREKEKDEALKSARAQLAEVNRRLGERDARVAALETQLATLKAESEQSAARDKADAAKEVADRDRAIGDFSRQSEEMQTALLQKEAEARDLRARVSELWKQLGQLQETVARQAEELRGLKVTEAQYLKLRETLGLDDPENSVALQPKVEGVVRVPENAKDALIIDLRAEDVGKVHQGTRFYLFRDGERIAETSVFDVWAEGKACFARVLSQTAGKIIQSGDTASTEDKK
ncbi:MAG: hypothetical protein HY719_12375 [Planctomycetes bacterium]|nr:hypothetical protein [Planctomycetota bacterium]